MSVDPQIALKEIRGTGIGPVSAGWMKGARMVLAAFEQSWEGRDDDRFVLERQYREAPYENFMLPIITSLQGEDREVLAGFAAVVGHVIALLEGGLAPGSDEIEALLESAQVRS